MIAAGCLLAVTLAVCPAADAAALDAAPTLSRQEAAALLLDPPDWRALLDYGGRYARADHWVAEDKVRHFLMSFGITTLGYGALRIGLDADAAALVSIAAAVAAGIAKEVVDRRAGGPFSWRDLAWDAAGVGLGAGLVLHTD